MKRVILPLLSAALCLLLLAGCGKTAAPEAVTICLDGEPVTVVDILNGTEQAGLTAVLTPADYAGEVEWSSEDSGIVKPVPAADGTCTLTAKKTGSTKITASCGGVTATLRVHVQRDQNNLSALETACTIKGVAYSPEKCRIYFGEQYYTFADDYGEAALYYGLDLSTGIEGLSTQNCEYVEGGGTWYDFFLKSSVNKLCQVQALCDDAREQGFALTEEDERIISERLDTLDATAAERGYDSGDDFLRACYGENVTKLLYREYLEDTALADKAYTAFTDALSFSGEEIAAHYWEMEDAAEGNDYPVTNMRHILVMAEKDADGNVTDEAVAAAHDRAQELYDAWLAGDRTEDSFADMANEYSEDSGSNTTGGLYKDIHREQMVTGIDEWLFADGRKAGDTAVIDNAGSYTGTHIVLFTGYGDLYSSILSRSDLTNQAVSDWLTALMADYSVTFGKASGEIRQFK